MNVLVSGADRGLGFGITKLLLKQGHRVYAGRYLRDWRDLDELQKVYKEELIVVDLDVSDSDSIILAKEVIKQSTDHIDMIISNAAITGYMESEEPMKTDYDRMLETYNVNSVGAVRLLENFIELMEDSNLKRLCFISSEAGSITQAKRVEMFSYCMSKAALNMYVKLIYNRLHNQGYSFRLYHPGWIRSYMRGHLAEEGHLSIDEAAQLATDYFFDNEVDESELILYGFDGEKFQY
ncbi:MAG TPA: SDR family NAD(P)-dependent oxidoreductase [Clostridiales bacterium]|nr:SDR family NAD(P)-dependent oxidoreductase [Clostridiales bacterium]